MIDTLKADIDRNDIGVLSSLRAILDAERACGMPWPKTVRPKQNQGEARLG
jgi:hypothetical protein